MKKKLMALILCATMVVGMTACGSKKDSSDDAAKDGAEGATYKVAMITDSGDITDQSFNQTTYESCKAFAEANDVEFNYYKPEEDSVEARDAKFDQAVADGANVVVLPGYMFGETIANKADVYPDVKIVALDVTADDCGGEVPANVTTATYQEELSGYMAGYAAVKMGFKHLGFLGGMEVPAVQRFGYGYVQGANAAAVELGIEKDITIEYVYGGQFFGDKEITAHTDTWCKSKGVEVIFACGGGIFTSAAESAQKVGAKVIGVDSDQSSIIDGTYGDGITVTSAMKGLGVTVNEVLSAIVLNDDWDSFKGKTNNYGIVSDNPEENFVGLPMDTTVFNDSFTQDDYKALVKAMNSGDVTVSSDTEKAPEVAITVNYEGSIK